MAKKYKTLTEYLNYYHSLQNDIVLVYHPTEKSTWRDRTQYLDPQTYHPRKPYNHRTILRNEVVIEHDLDTYEENKEVADKICGRLNQDKIKYAKWSSANKSVHIHVLLDIDNIKNVSLFKRKFVQYYTKGLPTPDLRLCSENHLIRAEYGVHEATGEKKRLLTKHPDYPCLSKPRKEIFELYKESYNTVLKRKTTQNVNELTDTPALKFILTSEQFRAHDDGRERALFMLIHVLKPKYRDDKEGLISFLQDWYKYSGGRKLDKNQIRNKVNYHWNREYSFGKRYLNDLLESIGRSDLLL